MKKYSLLILFSICSVLTWCQNPKLAVLEFRKPLNSSEQKLKLKPEVSIKPVAASTPIQVFNMFGISVDSNAHIIGPSLNKSSEFEFWADKMFKITPEYYEITSECRINITHNAKVAGESWLIEFTAGSFDGYTWTIRSAYSNSGDGGIEAVQKNGHAYATLTFLEPGEHNIFIWPDYHNSAYLSRLYFRKILK